MTGTDNQDYICSGGEGSFSVITLADGVSSCAKGGTGARISADTLTRILLKKGSLLQGFKEVQKNKENPKYKEKEIAEVVLAEIMFELEKIAAEDNVPVEEYSSTLAAVLHDRSTRKLLCISIGDSMIIGTSGEGCYVLTNPFESSAGCCVTTTEGAAAQAEVRIIDDSQFDSVIIFSDGAWRQLFERNRLKKEITGMLTEGDYDELSAYLKKKDGNDDYSFISMDIRKTSGARTEPDARQLLKRTVKLQAESDGKTFERTFTITKMINAGADGICYEAYHEKSGKGVLKEFYPLGMIGFERTGKGQLVHSSDYGACHKTFLEARSEFIKPYEMLLALIQKAENSDLSTFIPTFELYYGIGSSDTSENTVYVWTPDPELVTFSKICDDIHKHPDVRPEYKLFTVLKAIETLAKCIDTLHKGELIHRDIKPGNFGFRKRGEETLTQSISLFDIDKICSVWTDSNEVVGTKGYMEMEARTRICTNQTDIYSIGATLFTAIVITDETRENGFLYTPEYHVRLGSMLRESELIRASERNSDSRLRNILSTILKRCLARRDARYNNCEELLEDIEKALFYILPPEIASKSSQGEQWILSAAEKKLDVNKEKNSSLVMMYHLFENPLYRYLGKDDDTLNIVINGLGSYGQKFLDLCLQTGQLPDRKLNIFVIAENETDIEIYLGERKELKEFYEISFIPRAMSSVCEEPYGKILFDTAGKVTDDEDTFAEAMQKKFRKLCRRNNIHYVFTDLGNDKRNAAAASSCAKILQEMGQAGHVCYATEGQESKLSKSGKKNGRSGKRPEMSPVYMNADVRKSELYPEIERMAFNTHLVWESNLNLDYNLIRKEFRQPYNHYSCVTNVLSMKHKLFCVGIDMDELSFEEAAKRFHEIMTEDPDGEEIRNKLIWIEHRRWVTEKLCNGWGRLTDLKYTLKGATKDDKNKKHICIVRSRPEQTLSGSFWQDNAQRKWDTATEQELADLDELDRLSVELHRFYAARASEIHKRNLQTISSLSEIKYLVDETAGNRDSTIRGVFSEWYECIRSIWDGERTKVRLYKSLKNAFLERAAVLPEDVVYDIKENIRVFESLFYPVLASKEYRDWKKNDVDLIDFIPFVLTYTEKCFLVIPFRTGKTAAEMFANVSTPTLLNPEKILYLYMIKKEKDLAALTEALPRVMSYMRSKNLKSAAEFIIILNEAEVNERDVADAVEGQGAEARKFISYRTGAEDAWTEQLRRYLKDAGRGKKVFALERNSTGLSDELELNRLYDEFDWYKEGNGDLCYIKKNPLITADDMLGLAGVKANVLEHPEFSEDHDELWEKYCEDPLAWRRFCLTLGKLSEENDVLACFESVTGDTAGEPVEYRYILPAFCSHGASRVVQSLMKHRFIGRNSYVSGFLSDSCEIRIFDSYSRKKQFDRIFSNIHALASSDAINIVYGEQTIVRCDNLTIREADLSGIEEPLLDFFRNKGFIITQTSSDNKVTLTYGSRQIKRLMTDTERIYGLEIYHSARDIGLFDDVAGLSGEKFICILTRGMNSWFVSYSEEHSEDESTGKLLRETAGKLGVNARTLTLSGTDLNTQLRDFVVSN